MGADEPCSLCGSTRSARSLEHGATYCDDSAACRRRRRPSRHWTHVGPGAERHNDDHRVSRNGSPQLTPRCLSCGSAIEELA